MTRHPSPELLAALLCAALGAACADAPATMPTTAATSAASTTSATKLGPDDATTQQLFAYDRRVQAMSAQELVRERGILSATAPGPLPHFRLALVLAQMHGPGDLARAQALLDEILRTTSPAAQQLHGAARLFAAQYQERSRLELQNERLNQQLKEAQKRSDELQNKLDAMADIELSLPPRPAAPKGAPR